MKKFCESYLEHVMKMIIFKREKNNIINKRAEGIIQKCKNL